MIYHTVYLKKITEYRFFMTSARKWYIMLTVEVIRP